MKFIAFATDTQRLADQASYISYGPARESSGAMVGKYSYGTTNMGPHMPTAEAYLGNAPPTHTNRLMIQWLIAQQTLKPA